MTSGIKPVSAIPTSRINLPLEDLFIDEQQNEVGALLTAQAIERSTGKILLEIKMNILYNFKVDENGNLKITKARVFLETHL